jgi:hypothetical protein
MPEVQKKRDGSVRAESLRHSAFRSRLVNLGQLPRPQYGPMSVSCKYGAGFNKSQYAVWVGFYMCLRTTSPDLTVRGTPEAKGEDGCKALSARIKPQGKIL